MIEMYDNIHKDNSWINNTKKFNKVVIKIMKKGWIFGKTKLFKYFKNYK